MEPMRPPAAAQPPRRDYAPIARGIVVLALIALAVGAWLHWSWHQPFMRVPRTVTELSQLPAPSWLPVPVDGVEPDDIADTWGAPRGRDRTHEGVDIFAKRGTPVRSATRGVVLSVRDSGLGGRQVWVLGPGHERHYYAHLDDWAFALAAGDIVQPGSMLGTVGTTGNARGTPPHLHYGIYSAGGALNPVPRLQAAGPSPEDEEPSGADPAPTVIRR
ncbi:M23 family metallopeptidase [Lysobacter korlensis]|uniref:M23 family metallopeptidase n=1 Tax=Lysobacter korlensis TaxID=553636 RepID=A0ABV6RSG6_9GAMM